MPLPNDLAGLVNDLIQRVRTLEQRSPLAETGASIPEPGVFLIDGDLRITGSFTAEGKVSNGALTDPVRPYVNHNHQSNFPLSATSAGTPRAPVTVPVPAGYSRALVTCVASANAYNTAAASDFMSVFAVIEGDTDIGYSSQVTVEPGGLGTASQTSTALLTGVSGSFQVHAAVSIQSGSWAAAAANVANVDVTVMFLR